MYRSFTAEEYKNDFGLSPDYKVDGVLCYGTVFDERILKVLNECLADLGIDAKPTGFNDPSLKFVHELAIGDKTFWFVTGYGGAYMSACLHLACLFGSQKNILVGSCGGLKPGVKSGDFIIPMCSYGQESTVLMYNRESNLQYSKKTLSDSLKSRLANSEVSVWEGATMTCQASLAQSADDIQQWSGDGYFGVEMEASTVFAVSNHFSVPSSAIFYVADNLIENQTHLSDSYKDQADMRKQRQHYQVKAALQELIS